MLTLDPMGLEISKTLLVLQLLFFLDQTFSKWFFVTVLPKATDRNYGALLECHTITIKNRITERFRSMFRSKACRVRHKAQTRKYTE